MQALAASTFGDSFTPIDEKGNILYNTIYTIDSRGIKELKYILSIISERELYYITGLPPQYVAPLTKLLWLRNNEPEISKKTKKFLFTEELLQHKMGIRDYRINYPLCSTTLFFDVKGKKWSNNILEKFDIDKELFAIPTPSGTEVGYISSEISEELGFKGKVSIITGGHDQQCAAFGVGAISRGIASDGIGTVECVAAVLDEPIMKKSMFDNGFSTRSLSENSK